jgi:glycosyltransferase involved in cell wall biosynthesis
MKHPLVSIIVPSYNHERFVAQAVESVLAQSYRNFELILVDDGSRDGTCAEIERTLARNSHRLPERVEFIRKENGGAHSAINLGAQHALGEFLTILNSDDYFHPERIATLVQAALRGGSDLYFTLVEIVSDEGKKLSARCDKVLWYHEAVALRHYLPSLGFALLRDNIAVTTGNLFFTRKLFDRLEGFHSYRYTHDIDFILRALVHTEPKLISKTLLAYRIHGSNSIIGSDEQVAIEGARILRNYFDSMAVPPPGANRFAPCQAFWPWYFSSFARDHRAFFGARKLVEFTSGPAAPTPPHARLEAAVLPFLDPVRILLADRALPITSSASQGMIDSIRRTESGDWLMEGWATDKVTGQSPQLFFLFIDDRHVPLPSEGKSPFRFVVPAEVLKSARKGTSLRLYAAFERGCAVSLFSGLLGKAGSSLSPAPRARARVSATPDGWKIQDKDFEREWRQDSGRPGFIDYLDPSPEQKQAIGWAFDPKAREVPEAFLFCRDNEPVSLISPNWERPDIAQAYSTEGPLIAGFNVDFDAAEGALQGYALWRNGAATPLHIYRPN